MREFWLTSYLKERKIRLLKAHLIERAKNTRIPDIDELLGDVDNNPSIQVVSSNNELHGTQFFVEALRPNNLVVSNKKRPENGAVLLVFGYGDMRKNIDFLLRYKSHQIYFIEAGFLRSVLMDKTGSKYDQAMCFFVDELGHHYDSDMPSKLDFLLEEFKGLSKEQTERARSLMAKIHQNSITKYNDQPIYKLNLGGPSRKKVLVIEQARNDWAIRKSGGRRKDFQRMLERAIYDNPDSDIIVKIHPDTISGKRGGIKKSYFGQLSNRENVFVQSDKINPYCLINEAEKVYVFSSMLGFEALLARKEVHVFGKPCYAARGLTIDYNSSLPKRKKVQLEELFYVLYFQYTKYKNLSCNWCQAEEFIEFLLQERDAYFEAMDKSTVC